MSCRLLDILTQQVLLCDGAFGSLIQTYDLGQNAYLGQDNCTDILVQTRPDIVRDIHQRYFAAGCDLVETNSFGASPLTLAEFGFADLAADLNYQAAILAREAIASCPDDKPRFVLGSIGPGTKLPSLGHVSYDELETSYIVQASGLLRGSVDAFLIETCQDLLQIKAAVNGVKIAAEKLGITVPIFVQVTLESTGSLLTGADISAAATVINALGVSSLGINCATGPAEMYPHLEWLRDNWDKLISVQPNAGMPEIRGQQVIYPLSPDNLAAWADKFVGDIGVNMLGACCGSSPEHLAAVNAMLIKMADQSGVSQFGPGGARGLKRPQVKKRVVNWTPAVASLFQSVALRQENAFFSIGERCNATGSKKFRDCQANDDWEGIVALATSQAEEGSHALDLCTSFVSRNELSDMTTAMLYLRQSQQVPIVIDSTDSKVIEAALKLYGGKAIINSINFENNEDEAATRLQLAKKYGAAVIALTIDEQGMAKTCSDKLRIARRIYDFAVNKHRLPASDLLIDPLTFTIASGNADDAALGLETLNAIKAIATELPDCQILLGLSNISFGLKPAARAVLNSVFCSKATANGMTAAIVHISKLAPLHTIPADQVAAAEALIYNDTNQYADPLSHFINLFEGVEVTTKDTEKNVSNLPIEEELQQRIITGNRKGLQQAIEKALLTYTPLEIINNLLLSGMKTVGQLFGSGKMQLPFVLRSAETMKAAVSCLEAKMPQGSQKKAKIVLATVKGDVHDIGKNLVDIILSNNGFEVVNIGVNQPAETIVEAVRLHQPDAIGLSGLLVKSTLAMAETLRKLADAGCNQPVLLGGAALTHNYVETDCVPLHPTGQVAYARDAFDGLTYMEQIADHSFQQKLAAEQARQLFNKKTGVIETTISQETITDRGANLDEMPLFTPPFWGVQELTLPTQTELAKYLPLSLLFHTIWGYKRGDRDSVSYQEWTNKYLMPIVQQMQNFCAKDNILAPRAVFGLFPCLAEGDTVKIYQPDNHDKEIACFTFPRRYLPSNRSITDYFHSLQSLDNQKLDNKLRDCIAMQVVTMGNRVTLVGQELFSQDRYLDYLHLHGYSVAMTEALAQWTHQYISNIMLRSNPDFKLDSKLLGKRYSFGYSSCPNLEDQAILLQLLSADKIGVTLTSSFQLLPEQSTDAFIVFNPQAQYF